MTVLKVIVEIPVVLIAGKLRIGPPSFNTLPRLRTVLEVADINTAIGIAICALAIRCIRLECTDVFITSQLRVWTPDFCALPGFYVPRKRTSICVPVGRGVNTLPVKLIVFELSNICIPVRIGFGALSMMHTVLEVPDIFVAVRVNIRALSLEKVLFILTDVFVSTGHKI